MVHISKHASTGGAGIVALRLVRALNKNAIDAELLSQSSEGGNLQAVRTTTGSVFKRMLNLGRFLLERVLFILNEQSREVRFMFSTAITGENLSGNEAVRNADILHLHWLNAGFVSLNGLKRLLKLGKPVVWTFHDMWAFTGGCHHAGKCLNYRLECGRCPYLRRHHKNDVSHHIWKKKRKIFENHDFTVITPSHWMKGHALSSSLLRNFDIHVVPNLIDHELFCPRQKERSCMNLGLDPDRSFILFGAQNIRSIFKGFNHFIKAVNILFDEVDENGNIEVIVFGKSTSEAGERISFKTNDFSTITSTQRMIEVYNAANVMVVPSLQDNLPTTVMESMACGTPVVAFRTGGIPEMIDHKVNGYLADAASPEDLARGIRWILEHDDYELLAKNARQKVLDNYTEEILTDRFIEVYRSMLKHGT